MDKLRIKGGKSLACSVDISGAKNAALPELCAALLTAEPVTLQNVPGLQDVTTMLKLIRNMGVEAERSASVPGTVTLNAGPLNSHRLVLRSLEMMRTLSPHYLQHFLSQMDTLLALEQMNAKPLRAPARSTRRTRPKP